MCVYSMSEIKILKKDTYFYKVVRGSKQNEFFTSLIPLEYRYTQYLNPDRSDILHDNVGKTFSYKIGKEVTSDFEDTPGMYCYCERMKAKTRKKSWPESSLIKVLKVLVKKGTRVKYAHSSSYPLINSAKPDVVLVETLTPVEVARM